MNRFARLRMLGGMVVLPFAAIGISACGGGGSSSVPQSTSAGCAGDASLATVYVSFRSGSGGYAEGFAADLASCAEWVGSGLSAGVAPNQNGGLEQMGVIGGVPQLRIINTLSTRGNTSFDPTQDYQAPMTTVLVPAGVLLDAFGSTDALTVFSDAGVATSGQALSAVPALHASFLTKTSSSANLQLATVMQDATGGPVWNVAYDQASDRLFAAGVNGVVTVFDNFEAQVVIGVAPPASRTITPGAVDGSGNSSIIAGALHGVAYDAASDQLVIADFDHAALYVIGNASTASSAAPSGSGPDVVVPSRIVSGAATTLVSPTDIKFTADGALIVADQGAGGRIFQFNNFLGGVGSAPAPDVMAHGHGGVPQFIGITPPQVSS